MRRTILYFILLYANHSWAQVNWTWAATGGTGVNPYSRSAGYGIDFDQNNYTYLTGMISSPAKVGNFSLNGYGSSDILIVKYDVRGNPVWVKTAGGASKDVGKSIKVMNGYLYVSGFFIGTAHFDTLTVNGNPFYPSFFVAKLDTNGNFIWVKHGDAFGIVNTEYDPVIAINANKSNHIFLAGYCTNNSQLIDTFYNNNPPLAAFFLTKLDSLGNMDWIHIVKGNTPITGGIGSSGLDLAIDASDNIVYAVSLPRADTTINGPHSITVYNNLLIGKINSLGGVIWEKEYGDTSSYKWSGHPKAITIDANENIYICGTYYKHFLLDSSQIGSGKPGGFIAKFNSSYGSKMMAKPFNSISNNSIPGFYGCDYDFKGNILYAGRFCGKVDFGGIILSPISNSYDCDNFVASYDTTGNLNWAVRYGYYDYDLINNSATKNNMYAITGSFFDSLTLGNFTLFADTLTTNSEFFFLSTEHTDLTGIRIPNTDLKFKIYPNPTSSRLTFETNVHFTDCSIEVFSTDAKLVKHYENITSNHIDVSDLAIGAYFICLKGKKAIFVQKFLKN